eukprot:6200339-Pleurochrysis_carterae.AAC.3
MYCFGRGGRGEGTRGSGLLDAECQGGGRVAKGAVGQAPDPIDVWGLERDPLRHLDGDGAEAYGGPRRGVDRAKGVQVHTVAQYRRIVPAAVDVADAEGALAVVARLATRRAGQLLGGGRLRHVEAVHRWRARAAGRGGHGKVCTSCVRAQAKSLRRCAKSDLDVKFA